eukprot:scaffold627359_cov13-Prasinocladus_malaysianus.AAC.1
MPELSQNAAQHAAKHTAGHRPGIGWRLFRFTWIIGVHNDIGSTGFFFRVAEASNFLHEAAAHLVAR